MRELLDRVGEWYRRKYHPAPSVPDQPQEPAQANVPHRGWSPAKKLVVWGVAAFMALELIFLFMPRQAPKSTRTSLTDQGIPSPSMRAAVQAITGPDATLAALQRKREELEKQQAQLQAQQAVQPPAQASYPPQQTAAEAAAEERRKKDEEYAMSSSLIQIAEMPGIVEKASAPPRAPAVVSQTQEPTASTVNPVVIPPNPQKVKDCLDQTIGSVVWYAICEGTTISAVLDNRVVGDFAGPAKAYVLYNVLSADKKHIILPKGTIALGNAKAVDKVFQNRISVSFHRFILPNGKGLAMEDMVALDQAGETALSGKVNRHLLQTFGTAAAIGALSGFSQFGAGSAYSGSGIDAYRQGVAGTVAQQGQAILQRDLNRLPTVTIPEGHLTEISLSDDLYFPEYKFPGEKK